MASISSSSSSRHEQYLDARSYNITVQVTPSGSLEVDLCPAAPPHHYLRKEVRDARSHLKNEAIRVVKSLQRRGEQALSPVPEGTRVFQVTTKTENDGFEATVHAPWDTQGTMIHLGESQGNSHVDALEKLLCNSAQMKADPRLCRVWSK